MTGTEPEDDEAIANWLSGYNPTSGPGAVLWDVESGRRERPSGHRLTTGRRDVAAVLLAELVCDRTRQRPTLVAQVLGPIEGALVTTADDQLYKLGEDFLAACRCGWDHAIAGNRLRTCISEERERRPKRTPRVLVADVSR